MRQRASSARICTLGGAGDRACAASREPTRRASSLRRLGWSICSRADAAGEAGAISRRLSRRAGRDRSLEAIAATSSRSLDGMQGRLERGPRTDGGSRAASSRKFGHGHHGCCSRASCRPARHARGDYERAERMTREARGAHRGRIAANWFYALCPGRARPRCSATRDATTRHSPSTRRTHAAAGDVEIRRRGAAELERSHSARLADSMRPKSWPVRPSSLLEAPISSTSTATRCRSGRDPQSRGPARGGRDPLREAVALYERKGNVVSAAKARAALANWRLRRGERYEWRSWDFRRNRTPWTDDVAQAAWRDPGLDGTVDTAIAVHEVTRSYVRLRCATRRIDELASQL